MNTPRTVPRAFWDADRVIHAIRGLYEATGRVLSSEAAGGALAKAATRHCMGWKRAVRAAGLDPHVSGRPPDPVPVQGRSVAPVPVARPERHHEPLEGTVDLDAERKASKARQEARRALEPVHVRTELCYRRGINIPSTRRKFRERIAEDGYVPPPDLMER